MIDQMEQEARKPENEVDALTGKVIGAAICVHRELGPGFLESVYEEALAVEMREQRIRFDRQKTLPILYREHHAGEHRLDFLIENTVVLELKAVSTFENIHFAIVRSYLKAASVDHGLLMNFATTTLSVKRIGREFTGTKRQLGFHV